MFMRGDHRAWRWTTTSHLFRMLNMYRIILCIDIFDVGIPYLPCECWIVVWTMYVGMYVGIGENMRRIDVSQICLWLTEPDQSTNTRYQSTNSSVSRLTPDPQSTGIASRRYQTICISTVSRLDIISSRLTVCVVDWPFPCSRLALPLVDLYLSVYCVWFLDGWWTLPMCYVMDVDGCT